MTTLLVVLLVTVAVVGYLVIRTKTSGPVPSETSQIARLPGPGTFDFDIVGESKYQEALEAISGGREREGVEKRTEATLVLEDQNPHDNRAVRVDIQGRTVGYLSRDDARSYRKQIAKAGHPRLTAVCDALIVGGWHRSKKDVGSFGVKLDLPIA